MKWRHTKSGIKNQLTIYRQKKNKIITLTKEDIQNSDIDLYVMPHAWATPEVKTHTNPKLNGIVNDLLNLPIAISKMMGVPTIFINQVGETPKMIGLLGKLIDNYIFKLHGHSKIINHKGEVVIGMQNYEGFEIADVELIKVKQKDSIPNFDGWTHNGSKLLRNFLLPYDIRKGAKSYEKHVKTFYEKRQMLFNN